jgi:hypothetical protein
MGFTVREFKKFARLTYQDQVLLLRAFVTLVACRAGSHAWSFEKLQGWSTRPGDGKAPADRIIWAIEVASRKTGATCLCRALALQRMLSSNGHESELRIGVEKNGDQFGAHAWLVYGGQVVIGAAPMEKYKLITAWPARDLKAGSKGLPTI